MSWENKELGSLVKISKGKKYSESFSEKSKYRYINIEDLHGDNLQKFTNENGVIVNPSDVIIAWDGANAGKVGVGFSGVIGSTLAKLSPTVDNLNSKYFFWYLDSINAKIKSQRTGATIPHVNGASLKDLSIPLPPLHIQKQIANVLDKADALRKKDQQLLKKYDELAQSIFIDMFGDPVKNEKGWEVKNLGELCTMRRGASPRPIEKFLGTDVPWIKIGDATNGNDIYITETKKYITLEGSTKSVLLDEGSLVFANCGVSLGFARILKIKGCIHDGWLSFVINDKNELDNIFLLKLINQITPYLLSLAPGGTQPNLNTGIMKELNIILPPISLQKRFERTLINIKKQTSLYNIQKSESLFQSLLQKTFSGELIHD